MSPHLLRALEHIHGHLGWLSALALCHPAILLRRPRRQARAVTCAATLLVTAAALLGAALYPSYRSTLKPLLFASAPVIGEAFERKEHLAVATVVLAWLGLVVHWLTGRGASSERQLGRVAFLAYAGAAAFSLVAAALGLAVAVERAF